MDNHRYITLSDAVEIAATRCDKWLFAMSEEFYDRASLQGIAQVHDEETYLDEDSFYVLSPGGAIGFCEDGRLLIGYFFPWIKLKNYRYSLNPRLLSNFVPNAAATSHITHIFVEPVAQK